MQKSVQEVSKRHIFRHGSNLRKSLKMNRAGNRVRTDDLLITNQLLYQLSYAGFSEKALKRTTFWPSRARFASKTPRTNYNSALSKCRFRTIQAGEVMPNPT
jgi:hypothetical protein